MIANPNVNGLPGVTSPGVFVQPKDIFYGGRSGAGAGFLAVGLILLDGTKVFTASNAPYTFVTMAGTILGIVTASGKYAASILGLTTLAYASGGTSLTTDVNTAAALVARQGTSGTFLLTGPATAGASVQPLVSVAYSAVNTATGVVTITSPGESFAAGSMIQPNDGSQLPVTIVCDENGVSNRDWTNVNQIDTLVDHPYFCGLLNSFQLVSYPSEASTRAWLKAQFRLKCPAASFSDDFIPGT